MGIFVYEDDAVFGGVEGLAEVVGDEGADGTESEDMEAHWPVLKWCLRIGGHPSAFLCTATATALGSRGESIAYNRGTSA